jgi:hypothetical protein
VVDTLAVLDGVREAEGVVEDDSLNEGDRDTVPEALREGDRVAEVLEVAD